MTLQGFLEMGGYAWYVWPSYAITFVVLLINVLWPIVQRKQFFRQLWLKQKRGQQR